MASVVQLFFSSSWIITHFGKNPVSGGRPPVDRRSVDMAGSNIGALFHIRDKELIEVLV